MIIQRMSKTYCSNVLLSYKASRKHYAKPTWMMKTHKSLVLDGTLHTSFSKSVGRLKEKKDHRKARCEKTLVKNLVLVPVPNSDPVLV
jgi:hypothetical protein